MNVETGNLKIVNRCCMEHVFNLANQKKIKMEVSSTVSRLSAKRTGEMNETLHFISSLQGTAGNWNRFMSNDITAPQVTE